MQFLGPKNEQSAASKTQIYKSQTYAERCVGVHILISDILLIETIRIKLFRIREILWIALPAVRWN